MKDYNKNKKKPNNNTDKKLILTEKHNIVHNSQIIAFDLIRKNVRNINLRTKRDMSVVVSAHRNVPIGYILNFVKKKAGWILKNQKKYSEMPVNKNKNPEYKNGETICLLGRQLKLYVLESSFRRVEQNGEYLVIYVGIKDIDNITRRKNLVNAYISEQINRIFIESLNRMVIKTHLGFVPRMSVRRMKSRWGSCMVNKKQIVLNSALIHEPLGCIDYVVLHEVLHFSYPGHDKKFYQALASYMPEWEEYRKMLGTTVPG